MAAAAPPIAPAAASGRLDRLTVALLGNPNTGKSTLFTALAGIPTRIANYPGVTVERRVGRFSHGGTAIDLVDLPGTYSLTPRGPDEQVVADMLAGRLADLPPPDCVVAVLDATNLARNLFLASQALDARRPLVVALTLADEAASRGIEIDVPLLAARLGCPVVTVVAPRGRGLADLKDAIIAATAGPPPPPAGLGPHLAEVAATRPAAAREAIARYAWIDHALSGVVRRSAASPRTAAVIDGLLTHRLWGTLIFIATMVLLFTAIFRFATPVMDLISAATEALSGIASGILPAGALRSLVVDGVLAGVGGVIVFLPQIAILFLFIAVLEGCGYLARAAYLMDRLLVGVGLSGRSFVPLLSSFACAIPGIMAARTIENRRDRLLTILVAPLMSCSARLPVYLLLCGAFVPDVAVGVPWLRLPAVVLAGLYALGVVAAALVAAVLARTLFRGPPQPFVMELPPWRWPRPAVVLERVREAAWSFLANAGTLILAVSIVVWALGSYPAPVLPDGGAMLDETELRGEALRQSFLGRAGRWVEPVVRPLGWDWRIGCAAIASFPAREVVLGTLAVIYNLGAVDPGGEEGSTALVRRLRSATWDGTERPVYTLPVALSIMVFFALCAQCASTLVIIGRETGSWVWPAVVFGYMTALAWLAAWAVYSAGTALGW